MESLHDVIVIGSGPAGYTAAIYLARAQLDTVVFSGHEIGGQLMYTTEIENFPGFPEGIKGPQLMVGMRQQSQRFGAEIIDQMVEKVEVENNGGQRKFIVTAEGKKHQARAVVVATGAKARLLGLDGEETLLGRGLSTCAVCDAAFFRDRIAYVIGGGDAAVEDALALARFTNQVTLVHRRDKLRASKIMQERLFANKNISVIWNTELTALHQDAGQLTGLTLLNKENNQEQQVKADGVFYAIGHLPATQFLGDLVQKNKQGYVVTRLVLDKLSLDSAQSVMPETGPLPYPTMTSQEGIFAAGDNVDFLYRQAITAAGFGTMAALDVERWLERQ